MKKIKIKAEDIQDSLYVHKSEILGNSKVAEYRLHIFQSGRCAFVDFKGIKRGCDFWLKNWGDPYKVNENYLVTEENRASRLEDIQALEQFIIKITAERKAGENEKEFALELLERIIE